jgi:uncharacterized protein YndB with AHSA1/START domain
MPMIVEKAQVTLPSDREVKVTRSFKASRALVYRAWTEPALVRRWLLGPPGWSMPVCEVDFRVGGTYRYEWRNDQGQTMGVGGTYREIDAPRRFVATERFDEAWYPGESLITFTFVEVGGETEMMTTMRYESTAARDGVLKSPMEGGVKQSYDRLAAILEKDQAS